MFYILFMKNSLLVKIDTSDHTIAASLYKASKQEGFFFQKH